MLNLFYTQNNIRTYVFVQKEKREILEKRAKKRMKNKLTLKAKKLCFFIFKYFDHF